MKWHEIQVKRAVKRESYATKQAFFHIIVHLAWKGGKQDNKIPFSVDTIFSSIVFDFSHRVTRAKSTQPFCKKGKRDVKGENLR